MNDLDNYKYRFLFCNMSETRQVKNIVTRKRILKKDQLLSNGRKDHRKIAGFEPTISSMGGGGRFLWLNE